MGMAGFGKEAAMPGESRRVRTAAALVAAALLGAASATLGVCGPFTDVSDATFCPFVLEIFTVGITTGVTPTTYEPASSVSRLQMAAFLSRTVDSTLKRSSRRALLGQFWNLQSAAAMPMTTVGVGAFPVWAAYDGLDLWVSNFNNDSISRIRSASGNLLGTWTGAASARAITFAMGRVLITGQTLPGKLYSIDPTRPASAVTTVASNLPDDPTGIAFDGTGFWLSHNGGAVSFVTPGAPPWSATTVTNGFSQLSGIVYDGTSVWVTDFVAAKLFRLAASGAILQTVSLGGVPVGPLFDGTNIWVAGALGDYLVLVRPSSGSILKVLTGNGLDDPVFLAFDGERILAVNNGSSTVSLWKAADATPLGSFPVPGFGGRPASDGVNFFIPFAALNTVGRF